MSFISTLCNVATGAVAGIALATALPVFGAPLTITATGKVVSSLDGVALGLFDSISE